MLRTAKLTAWVGDPSRAERFHHLHWRRRVEVSLDCFVCERTGRTMWADWGEESGTCSSNRDSPDHPAPLRVSSFDTTHLDDRLAVSITLDWWSAPFVDRKRGTPSRPLTDGSWTRLHLGYSCPDREPGDAAGEWSIQSNLGMPSARACEHCGRRIATVAEAPDVRVLP